MRQLLYTLRVCGRKNYRLQDIQLSKIRLRPAGFGETDSVNLSSDFSASLTACLAVAPTLVTIGAKAGGEYRARTGDLLVANQALSQLS